MMKIIANSSFYLLHYSVFENGDILEVKKELAEKLIEQGLVENIPLEKEEVKEVVDYTKLKVSELKKIAEEKGIEIPKGALKKDIITLLNEVM